MVKEMLPRVALALGIATLFAGGLQAQITFQAPAPTTAALAGQAPSYSDLHCAGFYTRRYVEEGLMILGTGDGGLKNEYSPHDYVYLNKGAGWITAPGGEYMVIRPVKDLNPRESFPGQHELRRQMGRLYAEVGRVRIEVLHEASAVAQILSACDTILAGDALVPFDLRAAAAYKIPRVTDRFAPSSGKPSGLIVSSKEFDQVVGEGKIVYLNVGSSQGAVPGSYLRVFRSFLSMDTDIFQQVTRSYAREMTAVRPAPRLNRAERAALPRDVLGEVLVLSAEEGSSTGIITFSREEIFLGDEVEVE